MRLLISIVLFLNLFSATAQTSQTILEGFLRDSVTREELIGASVKVTQNDTLVRGSITDFDGRYRIALDPGVYDVSFSYMYYKAFTIKHLTVSAGQITPQDALCSIDQNLMAEYCIYWIREFKIPLMDQSPGNSGITFTSEMLRHAY